MGEWIAGDKVKPGEKLARRPLKRLKSYFSDGLAIWRQAIRPEGVDKRHRAETVLAIGEIIDEFLCSTHGRIILCIVCLEGARYLLWQ